MQLFQKMWRIMFMMYTKVIDDLKQKIATYMKNVKKLKVCKKKINF
jgi:hypothetical protein